MRKKSILVISLILVLVAGWFVYKYFFSEKNETQKDQQAISINNYLPNSCWIYHEYVYRVDFHDFKKAGPFFFVRNNDGTFSPSKADSAANSITGNGFLIDSMGGCLITENLAEPWTLDESERAPLKDLVDEWLKARFEAETEMTGGVGFPMPDYTISGQTVAFFAVMNDVKEYIEYRVPARMPGQTNYRVAYPEQKTVFQNLSQEFSYSGINYADAGQGYFQVLKSSLGEANEGLPAVKQLVDSFNAGLSGGTLDKIHVLKGDEFFYEGSLLFDTTGKIMGNLGYRSNTWSYFPLSELVTSIPDYQSYEPSETWRFEAGKWIKTVNKKN